MTAITPSTSPLTMSSLEIAELVNSRHDKVKQSIERLVDRGVIDQPPVGDGPKSANQMITKIYNLGKRDSYVVVAQLSPEFTGKLVDRWQELEQGMAHPVAYPITTEGPGERALLVSNLAIQAALAFGFTGNQAKLSADNAVRNITGVSPLELMGQKALIAPSKDQLLTVSDIAKRIGVGPMKVNPLLIEMGLQVAHRDHKNRIYYEITEKGETHAEVLDTGKRSNSGTPIKQIKWKTSVLDLLTNHLETTRDA